MTNSLDRRPVDGVEDCLLPLDHGMLNIPLRKRGNIDTQIDRYKADQRSKAARAASSAFAALREQKRHVAALLDRIGDYRIMALAKPLGCTKPSTARKALYRAACSNLPHWIAALEREKFPGGCATCWAPAGACDHSADEWLGPPVTLPAFPDMIRIGD